MNNPYTSFSFGGKKKGKRKGQRKEVDLRKEAARTRNKNKEK